MRLFESSLNLVGIKVRNINTRMTRFFYLLGLVRLNHFDSFLSVSPISRNFYNWKIITFQRSLVTNGCLTLRKHSHPLPSSDVSPAVLLVLLSAAVRIVQDQRQVPQPLHLASSQHLPLQPFPICFQYFHQVNFLPTLQRSTSILSHSIVLPPSFL